MKIGITGATGRIGKRLVEHLSHQNEIVTFGKVGSNYLWTLGIIPSPKQLEEIDVLIHLAWSLNDRERDFHQNIGGTLLLAQATMESSVPFLFISTTAATSYSQYGLSKAQAERAVVSNKGTVIRIGLVPDLNRYTETKKQIFTFFPNFTVKIPFTFYENLENSIDEWIATASKKFSVAKIHTILSGEATAKEIFAQNTKFALPIPISAIRLLLSLFGRFSLRARNLGDALMSVTTNKGQTNEQ